MLGSIKTKLHSYESVRTFFNSRKKKTSYNTYDILMISTNLSDIAILNTNVADYRYIIRGISKSEAINLMQNIDLTKKSKAL